MVKGKKPFIDRKSAVKFDLVHRSQHDPLICDETAPQRVLVEKNEKNLNPKATEDLNQRRENQKLYGIYFDDDYNYLQHLKEVNEQGVFLYDESTHKYLEISPIDSKYSNKLRFPSSVFASNHEKKEGVLNETTFGLRTDWDPDVIAALDNCSDENILEDDFVAKASLDDLNLNKENGEFDYDLPFEDLKSRFTDYSISSSVMHRNDQLTLLDSRFEKLYISYDDGELGDKSLYEIEGVWHDKHPILMDCYKQFKKINKTEKYNKEWDGERIKLYSTPRNENEEEKIVDVHENMTVNCESVLSIGTYNNLPGTIEDLSNQKIRIDKRTGLPLDVLWKGKQSQLNTKFLSKLSEEQSVKNRPLPSLLSVRPTNETSEEKRERKKLIKNYRSCRRIEKKNNFNAFKEEERRLTQNKASHELRKKIY